MGAMRIGMVERAGKILQRSRPTLQYRLAQPQTRADFRVAGAAGQGRQGTPVKIDGAGPVSHHRANEANIDVVRCRFGVFRTKGLLVDGERPTQQRLGLDEPAGIEHRLRETIERMGQIGMVGWPALLGDRHCALKQRDCFRGTIIADQHPSEIGQPGRNAGMVGAKAVFRNAQGPAQQLLGFRVFLLAFKGRGQIVERAEALSE